MPLLVLAAAAFFLVGWPTPAVPAKDLHADRRDQRHDRRAHSGR